MTNDDNEFDENIRFSMFILFGHVEHCENEICQHDYVATPKTSN